MANSGNNLDAESDSGATSAAPAPEYARLLIQNQFGALATKNVLRPTTLIGGQPGCNILLVSTEVAPAHCVLSREADGFYVRNLRNAAGLHVNDVPVEFAPLRDGDAVHLGPFVCRLETNIGRTQPGASESVVGSGDANSHAQAGTATLVVRNRDGATVRKVLSRHTTLIGTLPQANVQLTAPEISPAHCIVTREADGLHVRDLRSRNGTRVNGATFEVRRLKHGDVLEVGPFVCLIETDIDSTGPDASDQFDRRFHLDVEQPRPKEPEPLAAERDQLAAAMAGIESARNELDEARAVLQLDRKELDRARAALSSEQAEIDRLRTEVSRNVAECKKLRDEHLQKQQEEFEAHTREKQAMLDSQATFAAESESLAALRAELDQKRTDLEQEQAELKQERADLAEQRKRLETERGVHESSLEEFRQDCRRMETAASRLSSDREAFERDQAKFETDSKSLETSRGELDKLREILEADRQELARAEVEYEVKAKTLDSDRTRLQQLLQSHELERQHLREENDRSRTAAEQLTRELADLEKQKTHLVSQMQLFASDTDTLRTDQARLNAAFQALADERKSTEQNRLQIASRQAELDNELDRLNKLREDFARDTDRIKAEQKVIAEDRARLSSELGEVAKILSQLRTDREAYFEDEQKLRDERAEFNAANVRLEHQQNALKRAVAELDERNDEVQARRERLKAEQAYLRSGKRQFQGALDEFRAEQIRFRHAVSAVKAFRKGLARRRETRAEIQAIRAAHWAIPLGSEWIIDRELEGLTADDGTLLGYVDHGETGRVYVIEERQTGRRVAVKLESPTPDDAARTDRVENAWRSTFNLRHPNVVQSLNVDRRNGVVRIFMEYIEAINLRELIDLHGSLPWREVASYGFQAALALEGVHAAGRVHGAVVPSHLLVESAGTLRLLNSSRGESDPVSMRSLPAGVPMPELLDYAAPELFRENGKSDARSDLYQIGCVMYHALSGQVPFPVATVAEKIEHHATKLPRPIRRAGHDIPKELILAIKKLMAKQPLERFQTADEAVQALAPFARQLPAWFSFESVLAARGASATQWKPARSLNDNAPIPAPSPAEMEG